MNRVGTECRVCHHTDRCPLSHLSAALCGTDCEHGGHRYAGDRSVLLTNNPTYTKAITDLNDNIEQEQGFWRQIIQERKTQERTTKIKHRLQKL